jgi:hypothetical protein
VVNPEWNPDELRHHLSGLARAAELEAAHAREFVPDGFPAPTPVRYALTAAVQSGYALALREVLAMLDE